MNHMPHHGWDVSLDPHTVPVFLWLQWAHRRSLQPMQPTLARHALSSAEFDLLATLRRSGEPYRLAPTVLFSSLMLTSGAMTRQLHQLEKRGLIQRQINPADARSVLVQLSAEGLALIDSAVGEHVDNLHRLTSTLDATELAQLDSLLGKWMAGLEGEGEKGRDM